MFSKFCPDCDLLFAKLHSAITEADAIIQEAEEVIHASKPSENVDAWTLISLGNGGRTPTKHGC
jgi:hypothetical protein